MRRTTFTSSLALASILAICGTAAVLAAGAGFEPAPSKHPKPIPGPGGGKKVPATPPANPAPVPATPIADVAAVQSAAADFAFDLLRLRSAAADNVLISPSSLSAALAMAYAGSAAATEAEMKRVMRFPATLSQEQVLAGYAQLRTAMATMDKETGDNARAMRVYSANRVWIDNSVTLLDAYRSTLTSAFAAEAGRADFSDRSKTADSVNNWVKEQTRGLIPVLISPQDVQPAGMILTNAVYFKGEWVSPFREWGTQNRDFTLASGTKVQASSMLQTLDLQYTAFGGSQIAQMPYIGGGSMLIILPEAGKLDSTITSLSAEWLQAATSQLSTQEVRLQLPKISMSTRVSVGEMLKSLGMTASFSDNADFSGMTGGKTHKITDVIQAVRMDVDEKKTEAAAATAVTYGVTSAPMPKPKPQPIAMIVDRPYIMLVQDQLGQIHFIARITDPRTK